MVLCCLVTIALFSNHGRVCARSSFGNQRLDICPFLNWPVGVIVVIVCLLPPLGLFFLQHIVCPCMENKWTDEQRGMFASVHA